MRWPVAAPCSRPVSGSSRGGLPALPAAIGLVRLGALVMVGSLASRAGAQAPASAAQSLPASASLPAPAASLVPLPAVPRLQLSPPAASSSRERPNWSRYWRDGKVPGAWRFSSDAELRLELPLAVLELGSFSLSSQLETVPGRERDCLPDCRGPQWSTSLRLKYDVGELGPLRQAGPELELKGARPPGRGQGRGYFGAGFGAKF